MILHIDCDTFFVSVHRAVDKSLLNKVVAVGKKSDLDIFKKSKKVISSLDGAFVSDIFSYDEYSFKDYFIEDGRIKGIIITASYEARSYGIKTGMRVGEALNIYPKLLVLPPNYYLYHLYSLKLKQLLSKEIPVIEQFSIDEFFGDVSGWIKEDEVINFAKNLQKKIMDELSIPVSIGIAKSKYISKLATNFAKPFGIKQIRDIKNFIKNIDIELFPGISKGFSKRLRKNKIFKLGEVEKNKKLFYSWGKPGKLLYNRILGIDDNKLEINNKKRKSIGIGRTFSPIENRDEIIKMVLTLARHLSFLAFKYNLFPSGYYLKIKYQYNQKSKGIIKTNRLFSEFLMIDIFKKLFNQIDIHPSHSIISLNLSIFGFYSIKTYDIFEYKKDKNLFKLTKAINDIRQKYGIDIIFWLLLWYNAK